MSSGTAVSPIRLFIVDDHALMREGLVRLLTADPEFALSDLGPNRSAEENVAELRRRGFNGKVLLVTAGLPDREALRMIRAGVAGIFHKQHAPDDLRRSIRQVFEGKVLIEEHYLRQLVQVATADEMRAVKASLQTLFSKTGVRTRSQSVRIALERFREDM